MIPRTWRLAPVTLTLVLAGGCATVPATLRPSDRQACAQAHGNEYTMAVCAVRGRPDTLGNDRTSPNLWVALATHNASMADAHTWEITVTQDGKELLHGPLPPAPREAGLSGGKAEAETFVRLPGARWTPGRYRVSLVWTLDPSNHVALEFEVPSSGAPAATATPKA